MNGWLIAALASALGAGACRTVRLRPPVDLTGYASSLPASQEINTLGPIVRLRVPEGWKAEIPGVTTQNLISDGHVYDRTVWDLPMPELVFWSLHPMVSYAGAVHYVGRAKGMDIERIRKHEVRGGFAQAVDDPSLSRTRIDGRDAFILRGRYDLRETNLWSYDARDEIRQGDIAMAIVPLQNLNVTVVVILVSRAGVLSGDPALALAIFGSCRFWEPPGWPSGEN